MLPVNPVIFAASPTPTPEPLPEKIKNICHFLPDSKIPACEQCLIGQNGYAGMWTSIGCIPTDPQGFIAKFLSIGVGIAGGIAFLLIIFGGFTILTSSGNPERLHTGKELVSAAIAGLLLIIFSLFLLQLIGYNILGIPGFG